MTLRVQLFGVLADKLGARELSVSLDAPATAGDLLAALERDHPSLTDLRGRLAVAVNMAYVGADHAINEGDEIALIPPVSGG